MQQRHRKSHEPPSRSASGSPLASPNEDVPDIISTVAFVPFEVTSSSGVSSEARKAVRIQAAKASAAARKRTIARKIARQNSAIDESLPAISQDTERERSLSATSSRPSGSLELTVSPGSSPARSVSAGQLEPFQPYPIARWDAQVPALVNHFLQYFAPEDGKVSSGRSALRQTIWPQALENAALFHAILLNTGSHAKVSGTSTVSTEFLSQLKHATIESVNDAVARSDAGGGIADTTIAAIALLGGWELEYGTAATYDVHMQGLETIVSLRGGLGGIQPPGSGHEALSPETVELILAAGHDLPYYACRRTYFAEAQMLSSDDRQTAIPTGFAALKVQRLLPPTLVRLVSRIAQLAPIDNRYLAELAHIEEALENWDLGRELRARYSPFFTTSEDGMRTLVSSHIRLASLAICKYLELTAGGSSNSQEALNEVYSDALRLQPETLAGTLFEEVLFWCIFMICSLTGHCETKHMRMLKRLSLDLMIHEWFDARQALGRYAYSSAILDDRAHALWEAISSSTVARAASKKAKEPTRFAKGIQHPTTYIGRAILDEAG